jgi:hypothetical protein
LTLRFTADVFPRFSSTSYSICCPFIERAQPGALNSGDVNKHVPAATALRRSASAVSPPTRRPSCAIFDFGGPAVVSAPLVGMSSPGVALGVSNATACDTRSKLYVPTRTAPKRNHEGSSIACVRIPKAGKGPYEPAATAAITPIVIMQTACTEKNANRMAAIGFVCSNKR